MRIVVQRVSEASVSIGGKIHSSVGPGLLVLLGITHEDTPDDIRWLCSKLTSLRVFDDEHGVMNYDIVKTGGEFLLVSQFTLHASTRKGNRPSYIKSAGEAVALPLYNEFTDTLSRVSGRPVRTGIFGADMQVSLVNDGPVTIIIDSANRE